MNFKPFALVEWQSQHEASSEYCLADSGCLPARLTDVLPNNNELLQLLNYQQDYGGIAGSGTLRELIAEWQGAQASDVLVTVGGTEANMIVLDTLVQPGDHAVVFSPGYPQHLGCLLNRGVRVSTVALDADNEWSLHAERLYDAVRDDTKVIVITNPNTPTGTVLTNFEMDMIVNAAERVGAWLLVDEVHRGTELTGITPTFWGRYDRVVCVSSMSKAFGLPGIRVGWVVAPSELREHIERRHEYTTIATAKLSSSLAELALTDPVRQKLLKRTKYIIQEGETILRSWVDENEGLVSMISPQATAAGFVRYHLEPRSLEVAKTLLEKSRVLVIPGEHFGIEHHLRITHGVDPVHLNIALRRISSVLNSIKGAC